MEGPYRMSDALMAFLGAAIAYCDAQQNIENVPRHDWPALDIAATRRETAQEAMFDAYRAFTAQHEE